MTQGKWKKPTAAKLIIITCRFESHLLLPTESKADLTQAGPRDACVLAAARRLAGPPYQHHEGGARGGAFARGCEEADHHPG